MSVRELMSKRSALVDAASALTTNADGMSEADFTEFASLEKKIKGIDAQISAQKSLQDLSSKEAVPVGAVIPASVEGDVYTNESAAEEFGRKKGIQASSTKAFVLGGVVKMLAAGGGNSYNGLQVSTKVYGEAHPVTRALAAGTGASGGFIVPPDYMNEIIEFLRPLARVRAASPRMLPMPRGTLVLPGQASQATAYYGSETSAITASSQTLKQVVATYKKLSALVPITNDMMRYADPAVDAFVRDDLVKVLALKEDAAFLLGDGTQGTPRGFLSFANGWVVANGGTAGIYSTSAASTMAVNGTAAANSTGGNFVTSTSTYTLDTVASELGAAINYLDSANVPDMKRAWFFHPRSFNYLYNVRNSLGIYVYRDEMAKGTLLGYPFYKTTQIPTSYYDASSHSDCSFVFLVEMTEAIILDSMQLELMVSREGSYIDSSGSTVSALQNDQTLIRAITEHDFQMRHDCAVSVIQGVRWAP